MDRGRFIDLDENDDEIWSSWSSDGVNDLELVLPADWALFCPVQIPPDFLDWFRAAYEKARGTLTVDARRYQVEHRHGRWLDVLGMSD